MWMNDSCYFRAKALSTGTTGKDPVRGCPIAKPEKDSYTVMAASTELQGDWDTNLSCSKQGLAAFLLRVRGEIFCSLWAMWPLSQLLSSAPCQENSHRQHLNDWTQLCFNKTLFMKIGSGLGLAFGQNWGLGSSAFPSWLDLKLQHMSESPGGLVSTQIALPLGPSQKFWGGVGWGYAFLMHS